MALDLSALDSAMTAISGNGEANRAALELFDEDPDQPRFEDDPAAMNALVENIRVHGILQPVIVRRVDGRFRLCFGARRLRAARILGLAEIPYVVTEDLRQFDDYAQVSENEVRHALQPLELAKFIEKKKREGDSYTEIARRLHVHASTLTHLMALVGDVPPLILELYHSARCRSPHQLYQLRRLLEQHPAAVKAACAKIEEIDGHFIENLGRQLDGTSQTRSRKLSTKRAQVETMAASSLDVTERGEKASPDRNSDNDIASFDANQPLGFALFGTCGGEDIELMLSARSGSPDHVIVRLERGEIKEVSLCAVSLTRLEFR